ncbi:MAG: chaperonin GroES [Parcubacteria group bacterium Gr01-1014_107]|nr:MAG: chaperonin GroES [Parcubacteria group bacterium Gr01-1014_107]
MAKKKNPKISAKTSSRGESGANLKIIPLGDRVLIKPMSGEESGKKSQFGIIIPETVDKEKPEQGKVVSVGEGRFEDGKLIPMKVKVGDKILFSKYGYDDVKINDEEFYILKEENILAILK